MDPVHFQWNGSSHNFHQIPKAYEPPTASLRIIALQFCIFVLLFVAVSGLLFLGDVFIFLLIFMMIFWYFKMFTVCPQYVVFLDSYTPLIPALLSVSLLSGQQCGDVPTAGSCCPTLLGPLLLRATLTTTLTSSLACGPSGPPPATSFR